MEHYKYQDPETWLDNAVTYIEVEDGWTIRQITVAGSVYIASNIVQPDGVMYLADGQIDYDLLDADEIVRIKQEEFEIHWQNHLATRLPAWIRAKQIYPVGLQVHGVLKVFYPQGVIIALEKDALGLANYEECRASTKPEFMYPRHKVTALVKGYDELNQWVLLDSPHVHQECE